MAERFYASIPRGTWGKLAAGEYWIRLCSHCGHPGGAHVIDQWEPRVTSCPCGECPGWVDGGWGKWDDKRSRELTARPARVITKEDTRREPS